MATLSAKMATLSAKIRRLGTKWLPCRLRKKGANFNLASTDCSPEREGSMNS